MFVTNVEGRSGLLSPCLFPPPPLQTPQESSYFYCSRNDTQAINFVSKNRAHQGLDVFSSGVRIY